MKVIISERAKYNRDQIARYIFRKFGLYLRKKIELFIFFLNFQETLYSLNKYLNIYHNSHK